MAINYDKAALQKYMDDISSVGGSLRHAKDESFSLYSSCKQRYTRLYTELEQANRKAYNMIESAESMQRAANAEYELATRRLDNAEDDFEHKSAQEQLRSAQTHQAESRNEMSIASAAYRKAQDDMKKLTNVWERYQPLIDFAADEVENGLLSFSTLVSNGNSDLGEYINIMDKAQVALYDGASSTSSGSSFSSMDNVAIGKNNSSTLRYKAGNTLGLVNTGGVASVVMNIGGKEHSFPYTKSGAAKAYRTAVKNGDPEMIEHTNEMFSSFDSSKGGLPQNQKYVANTLADLEVGLLSTFDKEMVMAGSQGRKLNSPATETSSGMARGIWLETTFVLDDDYIPEKCNDEGLTVGQIKSRLRDEYRIEVSGIPYVDGVADFSGISIANISTSDIVMKSTGMSAEEYASLSQRERTKVFQSVFSDVTDGKSKRERNFDFADLLAAERKIPILGLPEGYTATDLKKWRLEHKFSWDEQVNSGYNLVPTIIHGNVSHTGLVSTSGSAHTYLVERDADMRLHPEKHSWNDEDAPISISDLLKKKK